MPAQAPLVRGLLGVNGFRSRFPDTPEEYIGQLTPPRKLKREVLEKQGSGPDLDWLEWQELIRWARKTDRMRNGALDVTPYRRGLGNVNLVPFAGTEPGVNPWILEICSMERSDEE